MFRRERGWSHLEKGIGVGHGMKKRTWKRQVEEECISVGLKREDAPCRGVECWCK